MGGRSDKAKLFRVTEDVTLPDTDGCRMQVVARDGIGLYLASGYTQVTDSALYHFPDIS